MVWKEIISRKSFLFFFMILIVLGFTLIYILNPENRVLSQPTTTTTVTAILSSRRNLQNEIEEECNDPQWCSIPMPSISYFKFDPPNDPIRWRKAQILAAKGEHVLLKEIIKVFPNHFDFIDGDISFRKLHFAMDFFVDERRDLSPLISSFNLKKTREDRRSLQQEANPMIPVITAPKMVNGKLQYPWEVQKRRVIPDPYDFRTAERAPVVGVGYTAYRRDSQTYFTGDRVGGAFIDRATFFRHWRKVKNRIDTPFIAVCSLNENWGFLSTRFPNRTAGWGQCCQRPQDKIVYDFLNHDKTLMLATNQHTNVSHPKLLILPRYDILRTSVLHYINIFSICVEVSRLLGDLLECLFGIQ